MSEFIEGDLVYYNGSLAMSIPRLPYIFMQYNANKTSITLDHNLTNHPGAITKQYSKLNVGDQVEIRLYSSSSPVIKNGWNKDILDPLVGTITTIREIKKMNIAAPAATPIMRTVAYLNEKDPAWNIKNLFFNPEFLVAVLPSVKPPEKELTPEELYKKQRDDNLRMMFGN